MISRSLGSSEKFSTLQTTENGLADFCHILFVFLVINADELGRFEGDAFTVKHTGFPISNHSLDDFDAALRALHREGLIARYLVGRRWYLQIINFSPHQPGLLRTKYTHIPEPTAEAREHIRIHSRSQDDPVSYSNLPNHPVSVGIFGHEGKGREGKKTNTPLPPKGGQKRKQRQPAWVKKKLAEARAVGVSWDCPHKPKCTGSVRACKAKFLGKEYADA